MIEAASHKQVADARIFLWLCMALFSSVLLPVLLAGRPCNDDLIRSVAGSYGWIDNGRYFANILMRLLELGASRATDIAPIPQLLAVPALAYAGVLLARRFEITSIPIGVLVGLPLGTQPFFLQNLSYRFDAVTMAAALLCSVGAVAMARRQWRSWLAGCVALLASFNLYQPAFNVFLVLAIFELAFEIVREFPDRDFYRRAGFRISQAVVACVGYKIFFTSGIKDWVARHGETIHSLDALPVIRTNAFAFLRYAADALGDRLASIFLILMLSASLPMIVIGIRRFWNERDTSTTDATLRSLFLLLWPMFGLIASFGPMLLLVDPIFAPRVFPAFGALISGSLISAAYAGRHFYGLRLLPYVIGSACLFISSVTAGAYSSAAGEQMKYEDRIASTMADDLTQLKSSVHVSNYMLVGSAGYAASVQHAIAQFPILERLIASYLTQDDFFTKSYLLHFKQPLKLLESDQVSDPQRRSALDACVLPAVVTRAAFRIRIVDDLAVVDFREPMPCEKVD
jgi:hypothetical protein